VLESYSAVLREQHKFAEAEQVQLRATSIRVAVALTRESSASLRSF